MFMSHCTTNCTLQTAFDFNQLVSRVIDFASIMYKSKFPCLMHVDLTVTVLAPLISSHLFAAPRPPPPPASKKEWVQHCELLRIH